MIIGITNSPLNNTSETGLRSILCIFFRSYYFTIIAHRFFCLCACGLLPGKKKKQFYTFRCANQQSSSSWLGRLSIIIIGMLIGIINKRKKIALRIQKDFLLALLKTQNLRSIFPNGITNFRILFNVMRFHCLSRHHFTHQIIFNLLSVRLLVNLLYCLVWKARLELIVSIQFSRRASDTITVASY